ncbi:MAG TPA: hypothetical protein VG456_22285, partial [Candidatus Sulfopaludibacter sp.]|nr:hypothetical protein [Candidatus Sulfopaludibacter sp.]
MQSALARVPDYQAAGQFDYDFQQSRRAAILGLMQRYPDDVFVQREYIAALSNRDAPAERLKIIAEYKALHSRQPGDAYVAYLYGSTLLGQDTPQAVTLFTGALEKAPSFPWPHLQLASVYSTPAFLNKGKPLEHVKAFLSACPAALEVYSSVT